MRYTAKDETKVTVTPSSSTLHTTLTGAVLTVGAGHASPHALSYPRVPPTLLYLPTLPTPCSFCAPPLPSLFPACLSVYIQRQRTLHNALRAHEPHMGEGLGDIRASPPMPPCLAEGRQPPPASGFHHDQHEIM